MKYSYSNVSSFANCPYKWWLNYKDRLKTIPETNADNALWLGLALHKGIEEWSVEAGLEEYKSHYNIITDENLNWLMQLEYQLPRVLEILPPDGMHEIPVTTDDYTGFIDYVVGDTIYDFKFSNNIENYVNSPQLSIYKYYLEKTHPEIKINHLKYVFVPKVNIRLKTKAKPPETVQEFRRRLLANLEETEIRVVEVEYDADSVTQFQQCCQMLNTVKEVRQCRKNVTKLCNWCNFQAYCESNREIDWMIINKGEDTMATLPKNVRRKEETPSRKTMWIYGAPFSGKTTFADSAPDPLMLNTDGNAVYVTAP